MGGAEILMERKGIRDVPFNEYLLEYIKASDDFMDGVRRGLSDRKHGRVQPWLEVQRELGLG